MLVLQVGRSRLRLLPAAVVVDAAGRVRVQMVWMEREKFEGMAGGLRKR
jgi:hypothetical protein